jgi:hypothetical protein
VAVPVVVFEPSGRDVADRLVQPDGVVLDPDAGELDLEQNRVVGVFEMRPLAFDVTEEALDPGLVGRGVGSAAVLGDGHQGHERPTCASASTSAPARRPLRWSTNTC